MKRKSVCRNTAKCKISPKKFQDLYFRGLNLKMKHTIFILFLPFFCFCQKDISRIECTIKSFETTCLENSKVISKIQYKLPYSTYYNSKIERIFGRFEDLNRALSYKNFKENDIDWTCNEKFMELNNPPVYFAQKIDDSRRFYFLHNYDRHQIYKGTEDLRKIKTISLTDPKKNLHLYNREHENDDNFEATFNYYNESGRIIYSYHQRGNQFDEFRYEYDNSSLNYSIYKNEMLWETYSTLYNNENGTEDVEITQYNVSESYQFDKKNNALLTKSKFEKVNKNCDCNEGFVTKIEFLHENKCRQPIILE